MKGEIIMKQKEIPLGCDICKGRCFNKDNNTAQQRAAHELLGKIIPNCCVSTSDGEKHCPYKHN